MAESIAAADPGVVIDALQAYVAHGLRRVLPVWGGPIVPPEATVRGAFRLVLGIDGRNKMDIPQGEQVRTVTLRRGDVTCIDHASWNLVHHTYAKTFLAIIVRSDSLHCTVRQTKGPGREPVDHWPCSVNSVPGSAMRHLVAALQELLPRDATGKTGRQPDLDAARRGLVIALIHETIHELQTVRVADAMAMRWLQVKEWVDSHLHEALDRHRVAKACGIHPNHVSRLFRHCANIGFAAYVREQRLRRAQEFLRRGTLSITEIARRCGFNSADYFTTVFRQQIGCAPRAWLSSQT